MRRPLAGLRGLLRITLLLAVLCFPLYTASPLGEFTSPAPAPPVTLLDATSDNPSVIMITDGFSACSAFIVENNPAPKPDLLVTAAHCFMTPFPLYTEYGEPVDVLYKGLPAARDDIAVIQANAPDELGAIDVAEEQPEFPYACILRGFNIPEEGETLGYRNCDVIGYDDYDGSLKGRGKARPGNSGGPVLIINEDGEEEAVGVVFAYDNFDPNIMYAVPIDELHKALIEADKEIERRQQEDK